MDSILQPYLTQYYSAIKQPAAMFEQILNTCDQILQNKDARIAQLEEENKQLLDQISKINEQSKEEKK